MGIQIVMKILAIIPARSGSKRLPNKNIRRLNGKPLIHYPIELAIQAEKKESDRVDLTGTDVSQKNSEK